MTRTQIEAELIQIGAKTLDYSDLLFKASILKKEAVAANNQIEAKNLWIIEQIITIHKTFAEAFTLLRSNLFYEAWCALERIEIDLGSLKKHFPYDTSIYKLFFVEKAVRNIQVVYPYRLFGSTEMIKKEKKCSVCDKVVSIRNPCGHIVGEIYDGEQCHRVVTQVDFLGLALVENPFNKFSVMFLTDPKTGVKTDHYQYDTVKYLLSVISDPYENWDLEISKRYAPHSEYNKVGRNDSCPCGSTNKYKKCCLLKQGVEYLHYEFLVEHPKSGSLFLKYEGSDLNLTTGQLRIL